MPTTVQFDVFEVLSHVTPSIVETFFPVWVQKQFSLTTVSKPPPTSMDSVIRAVEQWVLATGGSELFKCRVHDTDTLKRIISHVQRDTMTAPPKPSRKVWHAGTLELERIQHYNILTGKDGEFIKNMKAEYPGFWMRLAGLTLTVRTLSAESVLAILNIIQKAIQKDIFGEHRIPIGYMNDVKERLHIPVINYTVSSKKTKMHENRNCKRPVVYPDEVVMDINIPRNTCQFVCKNYLDCKRHEKTIHKMYRPRAKGKNQSLIEK
jgi:hypothetical protein